jgi:endogenous inhibitor of DNA gyrase (YacG/DUF329 family)
MSQTPAKILKCPICRKEVALDSPGVPFCSDRCRTIDLGKWASGDYKISSPILDPDLLEDLEHAQQQQHPTGNPKEWKN